MILEIIQELIYQCDGYPRLFTSVSGGWNVKLNKYMNRTETRDKDMERLATTIVLVVTSGYCFLSILLKSVASL
jgi:hypothetical protein